LLVQKVLIASTPAKQAEVMRGPSGVGLCLALFASSSRHTSSSNPPDHQQQLGTSWIAPHWQNFGIGWLINPMPRLSAVAGRRSSKTITEYKDITIGQHVVEVDVRGSVSVRMNR
jgi:carbohydrate-selective porin OprB